MLLSCVLRLKALLPRRSKPPYFPRWEKSLPKFLGLRLQFTIHQQLCPVEIYFVSNLFHLQFTSRALNYTGVSLCATSYYLPWAYNAQLAELLFAKCLRAGQDGPWAGTSVSYWHISSWFLYARLKNGTYYVTGMVSVRPSIRKLFRFWLTPPTVYIRSSWNLVYS